MLCKSPNSHSFKVGGGGRQVYALLLMAGLAVIQQQDRQERCHGRKASRTDVTGSGGVVGSRVGGIS